MYMWVACCIVTRYVRLCADVFWALVTYIPYCTILGTLHSLQLTKMMFNRCCQQAEVLSTHSSPCVEFASLLFLLANNTLEEFVYARPLVTVNSAGKTWCREAVARFVWKPLLLLNYRQTWTFTRIYSMRLFTDTRARTHAHTHTPLTWFQQALFSLPNPVESASFAGVSDPSASGSLRPFQHPKQTPEALKMLPEILRMSLGQDLPGWSGDKDG